MGPRGEEGEDDGVRRVVRKGRKKATSERAAKEYERGGEMARKKEVKERNIGMEKSGLAE